MIRRVFLLTVALLLGACATLPQQGYNREANQHIKKIQVLTMPQANVRLHIPNHIGYSFGLIGTLITEANRNSKETWLQDTAKRAQFNQFQDLQAALTSAMDAKGYELIWPEPLTDSKGVKRDGFELRKKYAPVDADAQLDLGFMYIGYTASAAEKSSPYRPTIELSVRLVSADGKKVLYAEQFRYHNVLDNKEAVILEPAPEHRYPKFEDLEKADLTVIDGLRGAVLDVANAVAQQL